MKTTASRGAFVVLYWLTAAAATAALAVVGARIGHGIPPTIIDEDGVETTTGVAIIMGGLGGLLGGAIALAVFSALWMGVYLRKSSDSYDDSTAAMTELIVDEDGNFIDRD